MDAAEFRKRGKEMVDYLATYMETLGTRRVTPEVEPGYLRNLLPAFPPKKGEDFDKIMKDVDRAIMPGITHWQHPNFHAYFPAGNSFPSILGDMLSDVIGCIGFSWAASPACTELEMLVCDWVGRMIGLPRSFLHESGEGGGAIQGCASECVLVTLLAARHEAIKRLKVRLPFVEDGILLSKLVAYSSKLAHSCVEKAGMIGFVKMRQLEVDDDFSLRGHVLENAIEEDRRLGLIPFYVCATIGTTACCSFDSVDELGEVCARENLWLHVDAAYAGNALICPEFQYLIKGIENCKSLNFNTNKWMQVNFDCSLMWVRNVDALTSALTVDPLYLQHKHGNNAIDLRHWGIPLSRRFRSLKLWFVLRMYGVEGLQRKIREQVQLAKMFEEKVLEDERFEVHGNVTMGLVCFRLQGPNTQSIRLLKVINESGKLHMVPALLNELYVIRFAICSHDANERDVNFAWDVISASATELLAGRRDSSKEGEAGRSSFESISESDDEVFNTDFDDEFIFDHQRCHVRRAHMKRNLFFKMVSDPKSYNPRVLRSLSGRLRSHSLESPAGNPGTPGSHSPSTSYQVAPENGYLNHNGTTLP
ncbi:aromatic-L-amino-acid decarboxylase-like [Littorina saxatilis]|uniref:aromatic-L-amino-acid decarboxylase-like n=1 Tax=Littorina saxatilis TaxID=31220 RepID=UPI0038B437CF